jgi:hypothetical protein
MVNKGPYSTSPGPPPEAVVIAGGGGGGVSRWIIFYRITLIAWFVVSYVIAWRQRAQIASCWVALEGLSFEQRVWQIQSNRTWLNICGKYAEFLFKK